MDPRFLRRGPFKDRASIRVAVLDADEPPRFSRSRYHMDVSENCPPACTVGRVSAVDPDTGLTNNIRYSYGPLSSNSIVDHLVTMQWSIGKPWVLAFVWMPFDMHYLFKYGWKIKYTSSWQQHYLIAEQWQPANLLMWQRDPGVDLACKFPKSQSDQASIWKCPKSPIVDWTWIWPVEDLWGCLMMAL